MFDRDHLSYISLEAINVSKKENLVNKNVLNFLNEFVLETQ
jgi:hypothetical protein